MATSYMDRHVARSWISTSKRSCKQHTENQTSSKQMNLNAARTAAVTVKQTYGIYQQQKSHTRNNTKCSRNTAIKASNTPAIFQRQEIIHVITRHTQKSTNTNSSAQQKTPNQLMQRVRQFTCWCRNVQKLTLLETPPQASTCKPGKLNYFWNFHWLA